MYLFGLEGSGFIISLGLTLLICGAIMFYCLKRFVILEKSIIEQGKVLQSIIQMLENNSQHISPNQLATNMAINSALEQSKNNDVEIESTKIEVSDNSDTDSNYSDSDSNSGDSGDSDSDSDNGNNGNNGNKGNNGNNGNNGDNDNGDNGNNGDGDNDNGNGDNGNNGNGDNDNGNDKNDKNDKKYRIKIRKNHTFRYRK